MYVFQQEELKRLEKERKKKEQEAAKVKKTILDIIFSISIKTWYMLKSNNFVVISGLFCLIFCDMNN